MSRENREHPARSTPWRPCPTRPGGPTRDHAMADDPCTDARPRRLHWGSRAPASEGWTPLFDGKTLDGWKVNGGTAEYKVEDGAIVGTTVEGSPNTFLCKGDYKDFVLELEVQCDPRLNSGVQVRSHVYGEDDPTPRTAEGGRRLRPAVRGRPQGDGHGGAVLRRGAAGQVAGRDQARGQGRLRRRRLEPLPDRRPGRPLPLVGQRGRRLRLHRRRGQAAASSGSRSTASPRARGRIRSAGGTSASGS